MPHTREDFNIHEGSVRVGSTGTIGSLMKRELESMDHSSQASTSTQRKPLPSPVSGSFAASPRKSLFKRRSPIQFRVSNTGSGSSSSSTDGSSYHRYTKAVQKLRLRKNVHKTPMLGSDESPINRNPDTDNVETVDIKSSSPMNSRIKKLGFSNFSGSFY